MGCSSATCDLRTALSGHSAIHRRHTLYRTALALTMIAACLTAAAGCASGDAYRNKNEAILRQIPQPPGVRLLSTTSEHYKRKSCEEPILCAGGGGYVTSESFSAEGVTSSDVMKFYVQALSHDWSSSVRPMTVSGRTEYLVTFKRDHAAVGLATGVLAPGEKPGTFVLSSDYNANP